MSMNNEIFQNRVLIACVIKWIFLIASARNGRRRLGEKRVERMTQLCKFRSSFKGVGKNCVHLKFNCEGHLLVVLKVTKKNLLFETVIFYAF